jgi:hypothetical protein
MEPRFLTILTGRDLPKIQQPRPPQPSTINEKTIADFTRVVEQTDILAGPTHDVAERHTSGLPNHDGLSPSEWLTRV